MTDLDKLTDQVKRQGLETIIKMASEKQGYVVGTPKVVFVVLNEDTE